jgi:hypothetical protein
MKIYRVEFKVFNEQNQIRYFVSDSTLFIEEFEEVNKYWDVVEIRVISNNPIIKTSE